MCCVYCGRLRYFFVICVRPKYYRREKEASLQPLRTGPLLGYLHAPRLLLLPETTRLLRAHLSFESHSFVAFVYVVFLVRFTFICVHSSHVVYLWLFTRVSRCIHLNSSIISSSHLNSRCGSPGEMNCQLLKTSSG